MDCAACGTRLPPDAAFCFRCGAKHGGGPAPPRDPLGALQAAVGDDLCDILVEGLARGRIRADDLADATEFVLQAVDEATSVRSLAEAYARICRRYPFLRSDGVAARFPARDRSVLDPGGARAASRTGGP